MLESHSTSPDSRPLRALDTVPAFPTHAMETTASSTPHIGVSTALPKGRAEQPMVVYDLSKSTATVLTANTTFCQMIGYELVPNPAPALALPLDHGRSLTTSKLVT